MLGELSSMAINSMHAQFVEEAIKELVVGMCVAQCAESAVVYSPLNVGNGKKHLVLDL